MKQTPMMFRWIHALRSGAYTQASNELRTDTGYCCLGVACDLQRILGVGKWKRITGDHDAFYKFIMGVSEDASFLPAPLRPIFGVEDSEQAKLSELNDEGWTFRQIATLLEWFSYREQHLDQEGLREFATFVENVNHPDFPLESRPTSSALMT